MAIFKKAEPQDARRINEIIHKAFRLYADEIKSPVSIKALNETDEQVENDILNNCVFVAVDGSEILGSLRIKALSPDLAYLYRFGVDPTLRNTGVGSGLLQQAIDYCKQQGFAAIALHTNTKYYKLARYYYGKQFFVHSTATDKGYIRALFIKELNDSPYDVSLAANE